MTGVVEQHNAYLSSFSELRAAQDVAPWLQEIRENAFQRFLELGFPSTHHEEWRFTNVAPIAKVPFRLASLPDTVPSLGRLEEKLHGDAGAGRLVFVNGCYAPSLSTVDALPAGVKVSSLAASVREGNVNLQKHLARHAETDDASFVALNTAFLADGAFLEIPRGLVVERPIHFVFVSTGSNEPQVSHNRVLAILGPECQAAITETYIDLDGRSYFTNAVTEIVAGEGAIVDHYKLQLESERAFHVATIQAQLGRNTTFTSHSISLGGALVRNDVNAVLAEGTECTLNGLYLVTGTQHVDHHTKIDHSKPHGTSHELYKGVLDGKSTAVFNGKVLVRKDAQKTDAKQTNKNLVLSENAVINTKPELQIYADDVRCTHGATIGQIDTEAVFYLQSRGIGREDARRLLIYAFAQDIIDRIKVAAVRSHLEKILFDRLAKSQNSDEVV